MEEGERGKLSFIRCLFRTAAQTPWERKSDDLRLLWPHPKMPLTNRRANGVQTATVSPDPGGRRYADAEAEAEYRRKGKGM